MSDRSSLRAVVRTRRGALAGAAVTTCAVLALGAVSDATSAFDHSPSAAAVAVNPSAAALAQDLIAQRTGETGSRSAVRPAPAVSAADDQAEQDKSEQIAAARAAAAERAAAQAKAAAKAKAAKRAKAAKAKAEAQQAAQQAAARRELAAAQADPQAVAQKMLGEFGFGADQWSCLSTLWTGESGWNYLAANPSSGAYGIPQALPGDKMASAGADWRTNPATQIRWGLGYIRSAYGSPCAALSFWNGNSPHWY